MVFIKVLVYLSSATCTMNLQNPTNGSKLPSRDFAKLRLVGRHLWKFYAKNLWMNWERIKDKILIFGEDDYIFAGMFNL